MQQFVSLILLKAQVAGYATVFEIASVVVFVGAFAAFFIKVPEEVVDNGERITIMD
jgi:hypothetical protein